MQDCLEALDVICSFLTARELLSVAQLSRGWNVAASAHFCRDAKPYFRTDWVQEPMELALPSHIVAMSVSGDHTHLFVCAKSDDPTEPAYLYIHQLHSGQRHFEPLPAAFASPAACVWFEGPHFLVVTTTRDEVPVVFDCERGLELRLPSSAVSFAASSTGRFVGCWFNESYHLFRFRSVDRHHAVEASRREWVAEKRRRVASQRNSPNQSTEGLLTAGRRANLFEEDLSSMGRCPHYDLVPPGFGSSETSSAEALNYFLFAIPSAARTLGSLAEVFVAREMVIVLNKSTSRTAPLKAFFTASKDVSSYATESESLESRDRKNLQCIFRTSRHLSTDECTAEDRFSFPDCSDNNNNNTRTELGAPGPSAMRQLQTREIHFLLSSAKCASQVVEHPTACGGTVYLLDASTGTMCIWEPFSNAARVILIATLFCPLTRRFPSACGYIRLLVPGHVVSFTTWETHMDQGGGGTRHHMLHFASLDGTIHRRLPLKGPSVVALLPRSNAIIVASATASSGPVHPLLEATEYGIGALIRFGEDATVVTEHVTQKQNRSSRLVWITWISYVVMGFSFMSTVASLVYNGWWLHMQFLFTSVADA